MEKFKSGDTVKLKSGGPVMTVNCYAARGAREPKNITCNWFTDEKLQTASIHEDMLILFEKQL